MPPDPREGAVAHSKGEQTLSRGQWRVGNRRERARARERPENLDRTQRQRLGEKLLKLNPDMLWGFTQASG